MSDRSRLFARRRTRRSEHGRLALRSGARHPSCVSGRCCRHRRPIRRSHCRDRSQHLRATNRIAHEGVSHGWDLGVGMIAAVVAAAPHVPDRWPASKRYSGRIARFGSPWASMPRPESSKYFMVLSTEFKPRAGLCTGPCHSCNTPWESSICACGNGVFFIA
jgi:hypothetical protein